MHIAIIIYHLKVVVCQSTQMHAYVCLSSNWFRPSPQARNLFVAGLSNIDRTSKVGNDASDMISDSPRVSISASSLSITPGLPLSQHPLLPLSQRPYSSQWILPPFPTTNLLSSSPKSVSCPHPSTPPPLSPPTSPNPPAHFLPNSYLTSSPASTPKSPRITNSSSPPQRSDTSSNKSNPSISPKHSLTLPLPPPPPPDPRRVTNYSQSSAT